MGFVGLPRIPAGLHGGDTVDDGGGRNDGEFFFVSNEPFHQYICVYYNYLMFFSSFFSSLLYRLSHIYLS